MRLHRDSPPPNYHVQCFVIGWHDESPVIIEIEPRAITWKPGDDPLPAFFPAFAKSCAVLWGENWHGPLETVCGLRNGTAKKWMKSHTIPPPMIVGWVAYLASKPNARVIGHALLAIAEGADMEMFHDARDSFKGMNDGG